MMAEETIFLKNSFVIEVFKSERCNKDEKQTANFLYDNYIQDYCDCSFNDVEYQLRTSLDIHRKYKRNGKKSLHHLKKFLNSNFISKEWTNPKKKYQQPVEQGLSDFRFCLNNCTEKKWSIKGKELNTDEQSSDSKSFTITDPEPDVFIKTNTFNTDDQSEVFESETVTNGNLETDVFVATQRLINDEQTSEVVDVKTVTLTDPRLGICIENREVQADKQTDYFQDSRTTVGPTSSIINACQKVCSKVSETQNKKQKGKLFQSKILRYSKPNLHDIEDLNISTNLSVKNSVNKNKNGKTWFQRMINKLKDINKQGQLTKKLQWEHRMRVHAELACYTWRAKHHILAKALKEEKARVQHLEEEFQKGKND